MPKSENFLCFLVWCERRGLMVQIECEAKVGIGAKRFAHADKAARSMSFFI
ncbi:hypothetical protein CUS_7676 [Ruminococcus albus 8]|uniref:Uncharacterized protein n=1 Tax=Ruminococcus albus 8 TaxID=246199 RepID=E9SHE7_RUMAL|nr:hypothetical protein CUS_7676 [Ruminococcus albus 8]